MISAKEANYLSMKMHNELFERFVELIDVKIQEAASSGKNELVLSCSDIPYEVLVSKKLEERLKAEDYDVKTSFYFPEACCVDFYLTISWPKKEKPKSYFERFVDFCCN